MKKLSLVTNFLSATLIIFFSACSVEQIIDNSPSYIVSFDSRGGSAVFAQAVKSGGKVSEPLAPSRTDYVFGGWYKDSECSNAWVFSSDTVISNTMLCAKWVETSNVYKIVIFDSMGGSAVPSQAVKIGEKLIRPTGPIKYGYGCRGWYKDPSFMDEWKFESNLVISNITLYVKWNDISMFSFSFSSNRATITQCNTGYVGNLDIPIDIYGYEVTFLGEYSFQSCTNISFVTIPDTVTSIGNGLFAVCYGLKEVILPKNINQIPMSTFSFCNALTNINIPGGVTTIGEGAFRYCTNLTFIILPENVTYIDHQAFVGCVNVKDFYSHPLIAPTVYNGIPLALEFQSCTLHIKAGSIGYNVFPWNFTSIFSTVVTDL